MIAFLKILLTIIIICLTCLLMISGYFIVLGLKNGNAYDLLFGILVFLPSLGFIFEIIKTIKNK